MAEAVKVIVRCRPMNEREKNLKCKEVLTIDNKVAQCSIKNAHDLKAPPKSFTFDGAYGTDSTTEQIYADIGYPLVEGVTEGYNGTIFAYGQTGCGKSFSMQGITNPTTQRGIIPRAFDHIFETIQVSENSKYLVHASYLEIYNEEIRDLLGKDVRTKLDLKEHPDKGVYVQSLSMHACKNVNDCNLVMERGWKNRSTGATLMNAESSRSHSIFTIHMERCEPDGTGEEHIRAAKLNLVDLAGSERQGKTGATGDRLKEATKINLSLSALGNVISALVDGKSKHIPYRDSKLTRLLQDSLGGNTKTLMVACLSPADNNYDETLSTLRYANRAKNIKNKPKINEDPKDAMLREYQDEISRLKMMLRGEIPIDLEGGSAGAPAAKVKVETKIVEKIVTVPNEELELEKERVREEYELKMKTMQENFEEMKMSKAVLQEEMSKLREQYDQEMATVESHVKSPGEAGIENGEASYPPAEEGDPTDSNYLADAEHAVHLKTVRKVAKEGLKAPRSSPTGGHRADSMATEEAMQRLKELQQAMVGGEEANNEEKKEKRRKKKKYAEERKNKLLEALANKDGEEIMMDIFDSTQMDLEKQRKLLEKQKEKNESLQAEILDLQSEFEFDRIDYLDTIRKQEQQMKWMQSVIDKIHPCLRRDCNYVNLDKVKIHSSWDEENQTWTLPKMTIEKSKLPGAPGVMPGARQDPQYNNKAVNGESSQDIYDEMRFEDRYLQKLQQKSEQNSAKDYFKSKRTEKLLRSTHDDRSRAMNNISPNNYQMTNGHSSSGSANSNNSSTAWGSDVNYDRAAAVHGQLSNDDLLRKPQRLESLAAPKSGKKKKKQYNMMEPL